MKNYKFLLPLIVALLVIAVPVSAATCSFINITQGIQGIQGINGTDGADGTDCTAAVGTVTSGSPASVTNVGTPGAAIFDFVIPPGDTGANGADGDDGAAATITIGTVTPGSPASVTNVGTPTNAIFDFVLVSGADGTTPVFGVDYFNGSDGYTPVFNVDYFNGSTGATGADGTAATIEINATFTLDAGQPATATNIGTTTAALFNFGIPQGAKGDKGDTGDTGAIPDVTQFLFLNGTRAMAGNLSIGSQYITGLHAPSISTDAATKGYVDSAVSGMSNYNSTYDGLIRSDYVYTSNGSYLLATNTSVASVTYVNNVNASMKGYVDALPVSNYNASYITSTYNSTYDAKPDSTFNATYDAKNNYNSSYLTSGDLSPYATTVYVGQVNTSMKNYVDGAVAGMSNYNASYLTSGDLTGYATEAYVGEQGFITSTYNATYDAKTNYNASYWTGTNYNASYWTGSNYNSSYMTSTYNATYDAKPSSTYNATYDAKANTAVFGYVTLMAGSSMITTTNPVTMSQTETSTNKNNYISIDFANAGTEVGQWVVDFPADWNSSATVQFTPLWTAASGSGGINFTVKAKLFPDDAALDTALAQVGGSSVDTLITAGDMHVAPATSAAAITSVSSGGNTAIIAVNRNSAAADDTLAATVNLIGLRVKYSRILA